MRIPVYIICCHSCPLNLFTFEITGSMTLVGVETGLFPVKKIRLIKIDEFIHTCSYKNTQWKHGYLSWEVK